MKQCLRRVLCAVLVLTLFASCMLVFAACENPNKVTGVARFVVEAEDGNLEEVDYKMKDGFSGAIPDALRELSGQGKLECVLRESTYGAYVVSIGSIAEGEGKYVYVFTSREKDKDTSAYAQTVTYEGKTLFSSGLGISEMTIEDGTVIYFRLINY